MKNAKNYLALLLVLGILFLAACHPAAPQDPGSSAPETSESTQTEPSQADPTEPSQTEPTQQTEPTEEDIRLYEQKLEKAVATRGTAKRRRRRRGGAKAAAQTKSE